jgi:hypothetical protein
LGNKIFLVVRGAQRAKIAITFNNATINLISRVDYHSNCTPLTKGVRTVKTKPVTWI